MFWFLFAVYSVGYGFGLLIGYCVFACDLRICLC